MILATTVWAQGLEVRLGPRTGKQISPLHFGANVEFYRPGSARAEALTADDLNARLPGTYRVQDLRVTGGDAGVSVVPPAWSVTVIRREALVE